MQTVVRHFMRTFKIILAFTVLTTNLIAQPQQIKVDTFSHSDGFIFSKLLVLNDSTFFCFSGGCVDARISKGKWIKKNGKLYLKGLSEYETELKVTINTQLVDKDTLATFLFQDLLGTPFKDYTIIFFDTAFEEKRIQTDLKGIIKTQKGQFIAFYTQNEELQLKVGDVVNDKVHYLWNKLTRYTVTLNYPTLLAERGIVDIYKFDKTEFNISGKKLIDTKNRITYKPE